MNDRKLKNLLAAARKESPPAPPEGFDLNVMQAIRRDASAAAAPGRSAGSIVDHLNLLFPRLAWAAAAIIVLCVAGDLVSSAINPSLSESVSQLSDQWLLDSNAF